MIQYRLISITTNLGALLIRGGKKLESPSPALMIRDCFLFSTYFPDAYFGKNPSSCVYKPPINGSYTIHPCVWPAIPKSKSYADSCVSNRMGMWAMTMR